MKQMPLDLRGMVRNPDHETSIDSARGLKDRLNVLQARCLDLFRQLGPMTDEELENQPEFVDVYTYSTVRKRRTELYQAGFIVEVGSKINTRGQRMKIWAVKDLIDRTDSKE